MFTHLSILECVPTQGKLSLILNTPRRDPPSNLHVEQLSQCQHDGVLNLNMQ